MFNLKSYFIKEHVGMLKLTDAYDIINPDTQEQIGIAKEEINPIIKILRLLVNKALLPTTVNVYEGDENDTSNIVLTLKRGAFSLIPKVFVIDKEGNTIGYLKSKLFSFGGAFRVFSNDDQELAMVKGDWKGWNFRFLSGDQELGQVTKKWSGLGKELFTSADNYIINLNIEENPRVMMMLLAAGLAIDIVYKEGN